MFDDDIILVIQILLGKYYIHLIHKSKSEESLFNMTVSIPTHPENKTQIKTKPLTCPIFLSVYQEVHWKKLRRIKKENNNNGNNNDTLKINTEFNEIVFWFVFYYLKSNYICCKPITLRLLFEYQTNN